MGQSRLVCLIYGAMSSRDWRDVSPQEIQFEEKELKNQLIPVLRKHEFSGKECLSWSHRLLEECRNSLKSFFPLSESEEVFLEGIFEYGKIDASLVTQDRNMIEKIESHPLLQWKIQLTSQNNRK